MNTTNRAPLADAMARDKTRAKLPPKSRCLTPGQAEEIYGVPRRSLKRLWQERRLPVYRLGHPQRVSQLKLHLMQYQGLTLAGATTGTGRLPKSHQDSATPAATTAIVAHPIALGTSDTSWTWLPAAGSSQSWIQKFSASPEITENAPRMINGTVIVFGDS